MNLKLEYLINGSPFSFNCELELIRGQALHKSLLKITHHCNVMCRIIEYSECNFLKIYGRRDMPALKNKWNHC